MMTRQGWGAAVVVAIAIAAGAAMHFARQNSAPAPSVSAEGTDWVAAVAGIAGDSFDRLAGPWDLEFPQDHGVHAEAHTELWQMSVHLEDEAGDPVGVQFLLFRIGLAGPDTPAPASRWEARDLYRGHVVLTGPTAAPAVAEERFGRGMDGLAGFDVDAGELRLDSWSIDFLGQAVRDQWHLSIGPGDIRIDLALTPEKDPLRVDGDATPFRGYLFSRLRARGTVATPSGLRPVSGVAWFEHLWGDLPIPGGAPVASDRLQLQLDDGSELSVVRSRRVDGSGAPAVDAFLIDTEGAVTAFGNDAAQMERTRLWQGAQAQWPVAWQLRLGQLQLDITPVRDAQEHAFAVGIWSGLVHAKGRRGDQPVSGLGTLQLTGYSQ